MKDSKDNQTIDFVGTEVALVRGQVLVDRQHQIAIVTKGGPHHAHLVRIHSSTLKLSKVSTPQLVAEWRSTDCSSENAVKKLLGLGKRHSITRSAQRALESLLTDWNKPVQYTLFAF